MRYRVLLPLLLSVAGHALGACAPLRIGYADQDRPPYFLGSGQDVPDQPGASVDLLREMAGAAKCPVSFVRLPLRRLGAALLEGRIDATPVTSDKADTAAFAVPRDRHGALDNARAMRLVTVLYVRRDDAAARAAEPLEYFRTHKLGIVLGSPILAWGQQRGLDIDDGAANLVRNLEKLRLGRIDGFAGYIGAPADLDFQVRELHGKALVRHRKLLSSQHVVLAFSNSYRDSNRAAVETMWNWLASHGQTRLAQLMKGYRPARSR
jgi:ABC-type amino acid transport substrate-binding protein